MTRIHPTDPNPIGSPRSKSYSRYLGTRPVVTPDGADYVLEITMRSFGLDARFSGAAYLFTSVEALILDRHTGREIWSV